MLALYAFYPFIPCDENGCSHAKAQADRGDEKDKHARITDCSQPGAADIMSDNDHVRDAVERLLNEQTKKAADETSPAA